MTRLVVGGIVVLDEDTTTRTTFPLGGFVTLLLDGFDGGSPQTVAAVLESLVQDGSPVVGSRSDNASVGLQLLCQGPPGATPAQQRLAAGQAEVMLRLATRVDGWKLEVTPPGGIPLTATCYRAQSTRTWSAGLDALDAGAALEVSLSAPRPPFWQGAQVTVPLAGSSLLVYGFEAPPRNDGASESPTTAGDLVWNTVTKLSEGANAQQAVGKTTSVYGQGRTRTGAAPFYQTPVVFVADQTAFSPANPSVTPYTSATVVMRATSDTGNATLQSVALMLTTNLATYTIPGQGAPAANGSVGTATFPLPTFAANETGSTWAVSATYVTPIAETSTVTLTLDELRFRTAGGQVQVTRYGGLYSLAQVIGSDRTPLQLNIREAQNRTALSTFVLHTPRARAAANGTPLVLMGAASNGSATASVLAAWRSTYLPVVHIRMTATSPTAARTIALILTQKASSGGQTVASVQYTATVTPALLASAQQGQRLEFLLPMPEAQLPYRDEAPTDSVLPWTVAVTSSNAGDVPVAVLMLDAGGNTVMVNVGTPGQRECRGLTVGIPDLTQTTPPVLGAEPGSNSANDDVFDWLDLVDAATGPLIAEPNMAQPILLWTPDPALFGGQVSDAPPTLSAVYQPSWAQEAFQ